MKNIVMFQTSFLGDTVITTAALYLAKKTFPEAKLFVVTTPVGKSALEHEAIVDHICVIDKKNSNFLEQIIALSNFKKSLFGDTVLLLPHRSYRSSLLCLLAGFKIIGYVQGALSFLFWKRVERISVFHEAARIGLLLEPLGVHRKDILRSRIRLSKKDDSEWLSILKAGGEKVVAIAPGSVWATKKWPIESYQLLAKQLCQHKDRKIVLLGGGNERSDGDAIEAFLYSSGFKCINLIGRTNLEDLHSIFPKLSLLIANDSSLTHYASAFNIPTITIFGATIPQMGFFPLANKSQVCEVDLQCRPCSDHGPKSCPLGHFKCMRDVSVMDVYNSSSKILE